MAAALRLTTQHNPHKRYTDANARTHHRLFGLLRREPPLVVGAPVVVPLSPVEGPRDEPLEAWGGRTMVWCGAVWCGEREEEERVVDAA